MTIQDWKTIDSAPKDGTWFLGWIKSYEGDGTMICKWNPEHNIWHLYCAPLILSMMFQPTHWTNIPEGPQ